MAYNTSEKEYGGSDLSEYTLVCMCIKENNEDNLDNFSEIAPSTSYSIKSWMSLHGLCERNLKETLTQTVINGHIIFNYVAGEGSRRDYIGFSIY